jgi:hypothetical protein
MPKQTHSPEPWYLMGYDAKEERAIIYGDGTETKLYQVAIMDGDTKAIRKADGDRIVACVNACGGIDDPAKAIEALRAIIEAHDKDPLSPLPERAVDDARDALGDA